MRRIHGSREYETNSGRYVNLTVVEHRHNTGQIESLCIETDDGTEIEIGLHMASTFGILETPAETIKRLSQGTQDTSEPSFYSCSDHCAAVLSFDPDEAVFEFLDQVEPADWPEMLRVYGWKRTKVCAGTLEAERVLARLLEALDEDYGDPDGDAIEANDAMKALAQAFVGAVCVEYAKTSWPHEVDRDWKLEVNVLDWVRENAPEWLEEQK